MSHDQVQQAAQRTNALAAHLEEAVRMCDEIKALTRGTPQKSLFATAFTLAEIIKSAGAVAAAVASTQEDALTDLE